MAARNKDQEKAAALAIGGIVILVIILLWANNGSPAPLLPGMSYVGPQIGTEPAPVPAPTVFNFAVPGQFAGTPNPVPTTVPSGTWIAPVGYGGAQSPIYGQWPGVGTFAPYGLTPDQSNCCGCG